MEAAMGREDSYVNSGQQWGAWNAVYGQPDEQGRPIPVWDQQTGAINPPWRIPGGRGILISTCGTTGALSAPR